MEKDFYNQDKITKHYRLEKEIGEYPMAIHSFLSLDLVLKSSGASMQS